MPINLLQFRAFLLIGSAIFTLAGTARAASEAFRIQLGLFVDIAPADSILSLKRIGSNVLEVELKGPEGPGHQARRTVEPAVLDKLVASAKAEGIPVMMQEGVAEPTEAAPPISGSSTVSGQRKNRLEYVGYQILPSSYTYGFALANALGVEGTGAGATVLFGITGSIVGHSIFAYQHSFEDSHIYGLRYAAPSAIISSYLASVLLLGPSGNALRLGSFLTLGAYPFSLWLGYQHGNAFIDNPGRIDLEPTFAYPFALAGFVLPGIYLADSHVSSEFGTRLVVGEALAFGVAGHVLSHHYRANEHIPLGVPGGIAAHTLFGFLLGLSIDVSMEPDNAQVGIGVPLALTAAAFGEGLHFFLHSSDNIERANFSWLGALGGAAFAAGILTLSQPESSAPVVWTLTGGAFAGYALTYALLKDAVEKTAWETDHKRDFMRNVSVDLIPIPEAHRLADAGWSMGYRVPGITVRF